jgi:hypothetical protein
MHETKIAYLLGYFAVKAETASAKGRPKSRQIDAKRPATSGKITADF